MHSRAFFKQAARFASLIVLLSVTVLNNGISSTAHAETGVAITRVSVASDGTEANDHSQSAPVISSDGRYVVFSSLASNLVTGDTNETYDIFVHDNQTHATSRVSVATNGTEGNAGSTEPTISADGRYIMFASTSSNLVQGDTNESYDIFLHDMQTGETKLVSVNTDGVQANNASLYPAISADGRYFAFSSFATNLVTFYNNPVIMQVYRHDMLTGTTIPISVTLNGGWGLDHSYANAVSADGRYVLFTSYVNELVPGDTMPNGVDVFVRDVQTGTTTLVSVNSDGVQENASSDLFAHMSADGRYIAFSSQATNLVPFSGDDSGWMKAFVHDMQTGETVSVATDSNGLPAYTAYASSISSDGRFVAFATSSPNLVPGDTNGQFDAFVHDMQTGNTTRVSLASNCAEGNQTSANPSISANGEYVAFDSVADNLVAGDTNQVMDIFVYDRSLAGICSTPTPKITLDLSGPASLTVVNNLYAPNPFDVTAIVTNNGNATATDVELTLGLPIGLSLVSGSVNQIVGDLASGQQSQVSWSVIANPQGTQTILTYSVTASASNLPSSLTSIQLLLPAISSEKQPEIDYFALGDSIASGHGLKEGGDIEPCKQSDRAYPEKVRDMLATRYEKVNFYFLACSGATELQPSGDAVVESPYKWLHNQVLYVVTHHSTNPTLVSITIGANDFGWSPTNLKGFLALTHHLFQPGDSYLTWVTNNKTAIGDALRADVQSLLENEHIAVVITQVHNPVNEQSKFFNSVPGGRCDFLLNTVNCYDRSSYAIGLLNTAYTLDVAGKINMPDRLRIALIVDPPGKTFASPSPSCGDALPTKDTTLIQYIGDYNSNSLLPERLRKLWKIGNTTGDCFHPNEEGAQVYADAVNTAALKIGR
jgi:Tol biopolymer transport system component/lysophospholipase L1-like esterase